MVLTDGVDFVMLEERADHGVADHARWRAEGEQLQRGQPVKGALAMLA